MIVDNNKTEWLSNTKTAAQIFIEKHLSEESPFFETFWQAFSVKINEAFKSEDISKITCKPVSCVVAEISFVKGYAQDFVTPIVTLTIAEVLYVLNTGKYSFAELEEIIHSSAARHGAKPSLTACLVRSLPSLCKDIAACKRNHPTESIVSQAPGPSEYLIWTEGKKIILGNMDKYEKNRDKYLLWIDLDKPAKVLTPMSIRLLIYLVENIGVPVSIPSILKNIFDDASNLYSKEDTSKINQQLVKLENYTGKRFRQYLMAGWPDESLGLRDEFRDKYFLFKRAVSNMD